MAAAATISPNMPPTPLEQRQQQLRKRVITEPVAEAYERVLGHNDLVPIVYLRQGLTAARAVCLVQLNDSPQGSGFLIGSGLLLTNNHVLRDEAQAAQGSLIFNYQLNEQGNLEPTATFKLRPDLFFASSEPAALDYAVVAVEPLSLDGQHQLASYGVLALSAELGKAFDGEFLTIIQHPRGSFKKIGLRENEFLGFADSDQGPSGNQWYIDYTTDTLPGSSGAPVLNDQWQLVALHSRGVEARDPAGNILLVDGSVYREGIDDPENKKWVSNRGSRASKILLDLLARNPGHPLLRTLPGSQPAGATGTSPAGLAPAPAAESTSGLLTMPASSPILPPPSLTARMDATEIKVVLPLEITLRFGQPLPSPPFAEPAVPPASSEPVATTPSFESVLSSRTDYSTRSGYDPGFLKGLVIELATLLQNQLAADKLAPLLDAAQGPFLPYTHFSTAQHRIRRMPVLTAVNIRGKNFEQIKRTKDLWILDPRLDAKFQIGPEVYQANDLDRGHMVRRQDPDWGPDAILANEDTFHYTNSCPQHKDLNQKEWNVLEDYVLNAARQEALDVSVFTGPVFGENDRPYRGVLLPLQFWKIAVLIKSDGTPSASGFLLSQEAMLASLAGQEAIGDTGFTTYQTYQVSLQHIGELTGLNLGDLYAFDPLGTAKPFERSGFVVIKSAQDVLI